MLATNQQSFIPEIHISVTSTARQTGTSFICSKIAKFLSEMGYDSVEVSTHSDLSAQVTKQPIFIKGSDLKIIIEDSGLTANQDMKSNFIVQNLDIEDRIEVMKTKYPNLYTASISVIKDEVTLDKILDELGIKKISFVKKINPQPKNKIETTVRFLPCVNSSTDASLFTSSELIPRLQAVTEDGTYATAPLANNKEIHLNQVMVASKKIDLIHDRIVLDAIYLRFLSSTGTVSKIVKIDVNHLKQNSLNDFIECFSTDDTYYTTKFTIDSNTFDIDGNKVLPLENIKNNGKITLSIKTEQIINKNFNSVKFYSDVIAKDVTHSSIIDLTRNLLYTGVIGYDINIVR